MQNGKMTVLFLVRPSRIRTLQRVAAIAAPCIVLLLLTVGVFVGPSRAQNYLTQTGLPTFTTAQPVELGFINFANGNLHLEIPLGSFPERGSVPFTAVLAYDSRIWQQAGTTWQPTNVVNSQGGWRYLDQGVAGGVGPLSTQTFTRGNPPVCQYMVISNFQWTTPDGTKRVFPITTQEEISGDGCPDRPNTNGYANDSSGFRMYITGYINATIYAPDGTQVYPNVKDVNGNFFSKDANGNVIDTLGRTPVTKTSNCNGNSSQTCYNVLNSQGGRSTFTVTTESISVSTSFGVPGVTEYIGSLTVIQSIKLPDNSTYQFGYDSYGEISSVTLPTGGAISYGYTNYQDSFGNKNRWVSSRISGGGTWSYTPAVISTCGSGQVGCQQKVTVTKPSNDTAVYTFTLNNGAWAAQVQTYTGQATLLSTLTNTWNFSNACSPTPCTGNSNIQKMSQTLTLPVPSGSVTSATQYAYDTISDMNVTSIKEWKYYSGSQPITPDRETDFTYHALIGNNVLNRVTQKIVRDSNGFAVAQTNSSYDDPGTLSNSSPATGIANHDDANYSITNTGRGNLTKTQRCTNLSACSTNYVQTAMTYDTTGQLLSLQDPNGNSTSFSYADAFFNDAGDGPSHPPQTYSPSAPTNAYVKTMTPPISTLATTFGYYYGSGQKALVTDANNQTTYFHYIDSLARSTSVVLPNGGWNYTAYSATETQVDTYTGITAAFSTTSGAGIRQDEVLLDNLGRITTQKLVSDPELADIVATTYDTTGRAQNVSHPYRSTSDPTYGLETPTYDGLNRAIKVTHQDTTYSQALFGAAISGTGVNLTQLCSPGTYGLAYPTLLIDEAGKKREMWTDGFGRTIEGDEPDSSGNLTSNTCYAYDSLGNLLQIVHGSQTRSFAYNVLSRLTSATRPESGTVAYSYDNNGNVLTKTGPAPNQTGTATVTICFGVWNGTSCDGTGYDQMNRVIKKTYSDTSMPTIQYGYDGIGPTGCSPAPPSLPDSNPKGRMTSVCDGSGATSWAHDSTGRITTEKRTILGVTATVSYAYNLDGSIATVTYPSGKVITYTVSNAQRPTAANDVANSVQFANAASYAPTGGLQSMTLGQVNGGFTGISESHTYNNRLEYTSTQATSTAGTALNLAVCYTGFDFTNGCSTTATNNNGSVTGITNSVDSGRTLNTGYDPLNRISSVATKSTSGVDCWGQNFSPDALANLNTIGSAQCSSGTLSVTVDTNNHINSSTSFAYDAAGNMTQDGSGFSYTFDDENHLTIASGMTNGPYCYIYDGNGMRVAKKSNSNSTCSIGTVTKLYWRLILGDTLAETDGTGNTTNATYNEYIFFAGRRIASRNGTGGIFYWFSDHLGSTRAITTGSGTGQTPGQLCYDADFTPYGQEISHTERLQTTACPPSYKFTGYERDPETTAGQTDTGLDYAFARYYSSRLGRFLTPDPIGGSIGNLQSHNAYSYVLNSPLNFTDQTGLDPDCADTKFGANSQFCPASVGGGSLGCTLDGVIESCGTVARFAEAGALAGVSSPLPNGTNGTIMIWLSAGSISYLDYGNWGDMVEPSWGLLTSFSGEWVTLNQFVDYVRQYNEHMAILTDDQRLRIVARGVVAGAGAIGDWRFIIGFYVASFGNAAIDAVVTDISAVEEGQMFGTRFNGNYPLFNTGDPYRIGWQYFSETGQYFFRINIGGVHIYLSPSWYF